MQSSVKDTYINFQGRLMFLAFLFVSILSMFLMILESYNLVRNNDTIAQLIIIISIFLGIMYSQVAMLVVEIVFQDEIQQLPIFSYLARLAPELTVLQRYAFLSMIFKRQAISLVGLTTTWIIVGGTHRASALVVTMTIITAFTLYGTHYVQASPIPSELPSHTTDNLTGRINSLDD